MMEEHPNVDVVRRGYDAFIHGDMDVIRQLMADDIEWTVLGTHPFARTYRGKAEVIGYFGAIIMETQGTLELLVDDIVGNDQRVVAVGRVRAERANKKIDASVIQIFEMNDIHRARRVIGPYSDDTQKIDEFWS